jgi:hypothetical protein
MSGNASAAGVDYGDLDEAANTATPDPLLAANYPVPLRLCGQFTGGLGGGSDLRVCSPARLPSWTSRPTFPEV